MRYELFGYTPIRGQWRWSKERSQRAIDNYNRMLKETGCNNSEITEEIIDQWYVKQPEKVDLLRLSVTGKAEHYIAPSNESLLNSSWMDLLIGSSSEIERLFKTKVFDTAKLTEVIKRVVSFAEKNSIIVDFFSGSATTAHAVMQLNAEDGGHRKYIMVQLPEPCKPDTEAYKAGYKTICDIGEERIRRAGEQILQNRAGGGGVASGGIDAGFKVFTLDTSNLKRWQPDEEHLEQSLLDYQDNFMPGRSTEDALYEVLLKMGLPLTASIDIREKDGQAVYVVSRGALLVCLDARITVALGDFLLALKAEYDPETCEVVLLDNGFASSVDKTNLLETLKCGGLAEDQVFTI